MTIENDRATHRFRRGDSDVNIARMKFRQIERHAASRIDDDSLAVCSLAADASLQVDTERRVGQIHCRKVDRCEPRGRVEQHRPLKIDIALTPSVVGPTSTSVAVPPPWPST